MDIQTKDGITLRGIPDGTPDDVIKERINQIRSGGAPKSAIAEPEAAPVKQDPSMLSVIGNAANKGIAGIPDAILNTPTNIINLAKAGYGTAATALGRPDLAPNLTQNPNIAGNVMKAAGFIKDANEPANGLQRVVDAMVQGGVGMAVNPASSVRKLATTIATGLGAGGAAGLTKEATGDDNLALAAGMLTPSAANKAGSIARQKVADAALTGSKNSVRDQTLSDAQDAGYVVRPSSVNPGFVTKRLESLAGKADLDQEISKRNQAVTNDLSSQELGLPQGTAITPGVLNSYRDVTAQPYRDVANISPLAASALDKLKEARYQANVYNKHYAVSADPESLQKAKQFSTAADTLENAIDKIASRANQPGLLDDLRDARTKIAKSYDIENALNLGDANVSAPDIGRAYDNGKMLTGNLETVGKFNNAFPSATREGSKVPTPGVSKTDLVKTALLAAGGAATLGPAGVTMAAAPLLSGPARSALLSPIYQKLMAQPKYGSVTADALSNLPDLSPKEALIQSILACRAESNQER